MEAVVFIGSPVVERPAQTGKDAFGVLWAFEEGTQWGIYSTIRARMDKVIEALNSTTVKRPEERRSQNVLEALENGAISTDEAEEMLKKKKGEVESCCWVFWCYGL